MDTTTLTIGDFFLLPDGEPAIVASVNEGGVLLIRENGGKPRVEVGSEDDFVDELGRLDGRYDRFGGWLAEYLENNARPVAKHKSAILDFLKGRSLPIGTKRTHGGIEKVRTAEGWKPVPKGRVASKQHEPHRAPRQDLQDDLFGSAIGDKTGQMGLFGGKDSGGKSPAQQQAELAAAKKQSPVGTRTASGAKVIGHKHDGNQAHAILDHGKGGTTAKPIEDAPDANIIPAEHAYVRGQELPDGVYLHGSQEPIKSLEGGHSDTGHIYLTRDWETAERYAGANGVVYAAKVNGPILDLGAPPREWLEAAIASRSSNVITRIADEAEDAGRDPIEAVAFALAETDFDESPMQIDGLDELAYEHGGYVGIQDGAGSSATVLDSDSLVAPVGHKHDGNQAPEDDYRQNTFGAKRELGDKNPDKLVGQFNKVLDKHQETINRFLDKDGGRLSALALAATGEYPKTRERMAMMQRELQRVMDLMEKEHRKLDGEDQELFKAITDLRILRGEYYRFLKAAAPSDAQKEAGNYKKDHVRFQGLDVSIENKAGSYRSGTDPNGKEWRQRMAHDYGYIKRTEGADGDHVDCFLGPDYKDCDTVFVVNQVNQDGDFDEHKVMIGFDGEAAAREGYLANYEDGWNGLGSVKEMPMAEFKEWIKTGDTTEIAKSNIRHFLKRSAGEGSRGGKIIGHTRGGNPIYESQGRGRQGGRPSADPQSHAAEREKQMNARIHSAARQFEEQARQRNRARASIKDPEKRKQAYRIENAQVGDIVRIESRGRNPGGHLARVVEKHGDGLTVEMPSGSRHKFQFFEMKIAKSDASGIVLDFLSEYDRFASMAEKLGADPTVVSGVRAQAQEARERADSFYDEVEASAVKIEKRQSVRDSVTAATLDSYQKRPDSRNSADVAEFAERLKQTKGRSQYAKRERENLYKNMAQRVLEGDFRGPSYTAAVEALLKNQKKAGVGLRTQLSPAADAMAVIPQKLQKKPPKIGKPVSFTETQAGDPKIHDLMGDFLGNSARNSYEWSYLHDDEGIVATDGKGLAFMPAKSSTPSGADRTPYSVEGTRMDGTRWPDWKSLMSDYHPPRRDRVETLDPKHLHDKAMTLVSTFGSGMAPSLKVVPDSDVLYDPESIARAARFMERTGHKEVEFLESGNTGGASYLVPKGADPTKLDTPFVMVMPIRGTADDFVHHAYQFYATTTVAKSTITDFLKSKKVEEPEAGDDEGDIGEPSQPDTYKLFPEAHE